MAPGFSAHPGQTELATALARITFPYLIMTVVAMQLSAMLNAVDKFAAAAAWSDVPQSRDDRRRCLCRAVRFPMRPMPRPGACCSRACCSLFFIVWAAARSHLRLHITWPRWNAEMKEFLHGAGRRHHRLGQHPDFALHRHSDRELSAVGRSDRALLCRPHQSIADGHARHRARHGAAARDVGAARAQAIANGSRRGAEPMRRRSACC